MNNSTNSFGVKTIEFEKMLKESYERTGKMNDVINHPSHYCEGRKYEPIDVIIDWDLSFCPATALKYISRAGRKDPNKIIEDYKKAIWYLNKEIERISILTGDKNAKED